jgi:hypothetical protein
MADKKKRFCLHCKKEIEEGKSVKVEKGKGGSGGYYHGRYNHYHSGSSPP